MSEDRAVLTPGVWGVLPTPFETGTLAVDRGSIERLVALYRACGATGLVALGVFGEASRLSTAEQEAVLRTVVAAAGDLPVAAGLSALATAPAVEQAGRLAAAADGRLRAVMAQVSTTDPDALAGHFDAIAGAAGTGVIAQDYPATTGVHIDQAALARGVSACAATVAIKAESPPTSVAIAELATMTDLPVFGGLGGVGLLDELRAGAAGAMTGFSHPEALRAAVDAFARGGFAAAREAFAPWLPLANFEGQAGIGLAIRKEVLRRRGVIASSAVRPPGRPLPPVLAPLLDEQLATRPQGVVG